MAARQQLEKWQGGDTGDYCSKQSMSRNILLSVPTGGRLACHCQVIWWGTAANDDSDYGD